MIASTSIKPFHFGLRDMFWVVVIVALLTAWLVDRDELERVRKDNAAMLRTKRLEATGSLYDRMASDVFWQTMSAYDDRRMWPDGPSPPSSYWMKADQRLSETTSVGN